MGRRHSGEVVRCMCSCCWDLVLNLNEGARKREKVILNVVVIVEKGGKKAVRTWSLGGYMDH